MIIQRARGIKSFYDDEQNMTSSRLGKWGKTVYETETKRERESLFSFPPCLAPCPSHAQVYFYYIFGRLKTPLQISEGEKKPKPDQPNPTKPSRTQSRITSVRSIPRGSRPEASGHNDPVRCFAAVLDWSSGSKGGGPVRRNGVPDTYMARCDSETPSRNAWGSAIRRYPYVGFRPRFPAGAVRDGWGVLKSVGVHTPTDGRSRMGDADDRQKKTRKARWRMGMIEGLLVVARPPACEAEGIPTDNNRSPVGSEVACEGFRSRATRTCCEAPSKASSARISFSNTCLRRIPLAENIPTVETRTPARRRSQPLPLRPCRCGGFDVASRWFDG